MSDLDDPKNAEPGAGDTGNRDEDKGAVDYFLDGDEEGLKKFVHDTVVKKVSDFVRSPKTDDEGDA